MRGFVESPTCSEDLQLFNFTSIVETSRAHMAESSSLLTSQSATNDSGRAAPQAAPLQRRNTIETGWLEFNDWLETRLEDLGLDANLYSRLIHSVLRQQPINSDESSRQSSVKTTLVEILRSDSDQYFVGSLVEEMVNRYCELRAYSPNHEGRVNDSVDSGVCPSPDESFQNYDEAFPPLSDSCCDELTFFAASAGSQDNLVAAGRDETEPSGVKWPTDRKERRTWGYQGRLSDSSNSSGTSVASVVSATPSKKLKCENEAGKQSTVATHTSRNPPLTRKQPHHRPLNSCPDFLQHQNFCQPHRHQIAKAPLQSSSFSFPAYPDGVKTGVSPYFVVPKCRKTSPVSSCGSGKQRKRHWSGGGKSGKSHGVEQLKSFALAIDNNNSGPTSIFNQNQLHTEDVPAWQQCNEWVCPVHRGAEFHFWSARIGGLGEVACRSCAKPPSQDGIFSCDEDAMEIGASPSLQQSDGFNSPEGSTNTSATGSYGSGGGINMFDAPQFILHIINEDSSSSPPPATSQDTGNMPTSFKEAANDLQWSAAAEEASVDKWGDNGTKLDSAAVWGTGDKEGLAPEFTFNVIREKFSSPYDNVANQPVSFCLPKFSTIQSNSGDGQYGGQQSNTLSQLFSLVGMANGNYPGAQQSLPPGLSTLLPILSEQLMKGSKVELSPVKTQPPPPPPPQQQQQQQPQPTFYQSQQQVPKIAEEKRQPVKVPAIPVSPQTHFVPIRSESMEDAYYPKPGFDEVNTWISPEGYHTLQQPVGKTNWRSLSLKFKSCQTDESLLALEESALLPDISIASLPSGSNTPTCGSLIFPLEADMAPTIQSNMPTEGRLFSGEMAKAGLNEIELTPVWKASRSLSDGTNQIADLSSSTSLLPTPDYFSVVKADPSPASVCPVETASVPLLPQCGTDSQARLWRCLDEQDEDQLLRYVSNISLLSPLESATTTTV